LEAVLDHYNTAPSAPSGHTEIEALGLGERQLNAIIAFLGTLNSEIVSP
jgi:cytochrome c peroxidase